MLSIRFVCVGIVYLIEIKLLLQILWVYINNIIYHTLIFTVKNYAIFKIFIIYIKKSLINMMYYTKN